MFKRSNRLIKLIGLLTFTGLLSACATTAADADPNINNQQAKIPQGLLYGAAADMVTTEIGMETVKGVRELNPLGVVGAHAAKAVYIYGFRPWISDARELYESDRIVASMWLGGSVNNVFVVLAKKSALVAASPLVLGVSIWWIYENYPQQPADK